MPREAIDVLAELANKIKEGRATPVDIMQIYRSLRDLPPVEASSIMQEVSGGSFAVVPIEPPAHWNERAKRAYRMFIQKALEEMEGMVSQVDTTQ
jgi:hypothetical protein